MWTQGKNFLPPQTVFICVFILLRGEEDGGVMQCFNFALNPHLFDKLAWWYMTWPQMYETESLILDKNCTCHAHKFSNGFSTVVYS